MKYHHNNCHVPKPLLPKLRSFMNVSIVSGKSEDDQEVFQMRAIGTPQLYLKASLSPKLTLFGF